jgi:hypothetical protein
MWAALRAARFAATTGQPVTACPYDPAGDGRQHLLALIFVREYLRLRPSSAVDHDD